MCGSTVTDFTKHLGKTIQVVLYILVILFGIMRGKSRFVGLTFFFFFLPEDLTCFFQLRQVVESKHIHFHLLACLPGLEGERKFHFPKVRTL